jgi:hypothetical protein
MTFAAKFDIPAYNACTQVNICLKAPPLAITSATPHMTGNKRMQINIFIIGASDTISGAKRQKDDFMRQAVMPTWDRRLYRHGQTVIPAWDRR